MRLDGKWEVADTAAVAARMSALRSGADRAAATAESFDIAVPGESEGDDASRLDRYAEHAQAGATWWVEAVHPWRYGWAEDRPWPLAAMRERIEAGP
jgi:hypothetical protein